MEEMLILLELIYKMNKAPTLVATLLFLELKIISGFTGRKHTKEL